MSYLSQNLTRLRQKNGYPPEYTARMIGAKPEELLKWENGEATPSKKELSLLATLYSTTPEALKSPPATPPKAPSRTEEAPHEASGACRDSHVFGEEEPKPSSHHERIEIHRTTVNGRTETTTKGTSSSGRTESETAASAKTATSGLNGGRSDVFVPNRLISYLESGEIPLWSGKPTSRTDKGYFKVFRTVNSSVGTVFSILISVFLFFISTAYLGEILSSFPAILVIIVLLFALGERCGISFTLGKTKSNTHYLITNRRVLLLSVASARKTAFRQVRFDQNVDLVLLPGKNGSGSILFLSNPPELKREKKGGAVSSGQTHILLTFGLCDIPDYRTALEILQTAQHKFEQENA